MTFESGDGRASRKGFLNDYDSDGKRESTVPQSRTFAADHYQSKAFSREAATGRDDEYSLQSPRRGIFSLFVVQLTVTSALGGFLFGYDTGVVSGAMLLIHDDFDLSDVEEEIVVSITIAAAVAASLAGGPAMERWGRRPAILAAAIVFTVGAALLAASKSYPELVFGRLIVGVGIGLASLTTPVYIAEAAPSHVRGTLVTLNTLFITCGQVIAGVVDGLFAGVDGGWRYMLGLSAIPSSFMLIGFLFLPESPRWLVAAGRPHEALTVLRIIRGTDNVDAELEEMIHSATDHDSPGRMLKASATVAGLVQDPRIRRALLLGCGLQLLQQLSGINTVMYYSATICRCEADLWQVKQYPTQMSTTIRKGIKSSLFDLKTSSDHRSKCRNRESQYQRWLFIVVSRKALPAMIFFHQFPKRTYHMFPHCSGYYCSSASF